MAASTNDGRQKESDQIPKSENERQTFGNSFETENGVAKAAEFYDRIRRVLSDSIIGSQITRSIGSNENQSDDEAFLQRLSTYSSFAWSIKPRSVAPPICASLGWVIAQKNLLECVSCRQFLCTELPPVWKQAAYDHAVSTLRQSLTGKHNQFCSWPLNPSKQNYLHDRLLDSKSSLKAFATTLCQLNQFEDNDLPNIASDLPEELVMCDFLLQTGASLIQLEHVKLRKDVLVLAICGWQTKLTSLGHQKIFCDTCFRETLPHLYTCTSSARKQLSTSLDTSTEDYSPLPKRSRNSESGPFHPLKEHQSWCPWVDANYQTANGTPIKEGWKSLMDILTTRSKDDETKGSSAITSTVSPRNGVLTTKRIIRNWIADISLEDVLLID